jgi:hypothetical protein
MAANGTDSPEIQGTRLLQARLSVGFAPENAGVASAVKAREVGPSRWSHRSSTSAAHDWKGNGADLLEYDRFK